MRRHGQKSSAKESCPKGERQVVGPAKGKHLKFSGGGAYRVDLVPAAWHQLQKHVRGHKRPTDINDQLDQVGPNDSCDTAFEGVDQGKHTNNCDGPVRQVWKIRKGCGK